MTPIRGTTLGNNEKNLSTFYYVDKCKKGIPVRTVVSTLPITDSSD
jgi:hypothetical protein